MCVSGDERIGIVGVVGLTKEKLNDLDIGDAGLALRWLLSCE